jgi:hypothetical protein
LDNFYKYNTTGCPYINLLLCDYMALYPRKVSFLSVSSVQWHTTLSLKAATFSAMHECEHNSNTTLEAFKKVKYELSTQLE